MSPPERNIERQKRRHRGPLIGITVILVFVGGLLVWWLLYEATGGTGPTGADAQMDSRTGTVTPNDASGSVGGSGPGTADNAPAPPPPPVTNN